MRENSKIYIFYFLKVSFQRENSHLYIVPIKNPNWTFAALVWKIVDTRSRTRQTDLRTYYIDAHQFSEICLGTTKGIVNIPYLAIQLTQSQEKHHILRTKSSAMGLFTALKQKMRILKHAKTEMLSPNQPLLLVKVI